MGLTQIDSGEFEDTLCGELDIKHIAGTVYAIAHMGVDYDGFLRTINIAADGTIGAQIDEHEYDTVLGYTNTLFALPNVANGYIIGYQGSGSDGWLKTFTIQDNGTIAEVDSYEIDATYGRHFQFYHLGGTVYLVAYQQAAYGWFKTININNDGTFGALIGAQKYDGVLGAFPSLRHISGDIFAVAYTGPGSDGWLKTWEIQADGTIEVAPGTDSFEFDTVFGAHPKLIHISGTVYAIVYQGPPDLTTGQGFMKTLTIAANGTIGAVIQTWNFSPPQRCLNPKIIDLGDNIFAVTYGWYTLPTGRTFTVQIDNDGTIQTATQDEVTFDAVRCQDSSVLRIGTSKSYIIAYIGPDDDGWLATMTALPDALVITLAGLDVTSKTLAVRTERGQDSELAQATAGVCELVCDNQNGDFSPENAAGLYYGTLALGKVIEVYEDYGGVRYRHFTGRIEKITPHGETENLVAFITALDGMNDLAQLEINTVLRSDTESGTLVGDILDAAAWAAGDRDIDTGVDTLQLGWFHKLKALAALRILEQIELGRFYITPAGVATWENRHARLTGAGLVSQHDFEDTPVELAYEWSKKLVYNQVVVRGRRYFIGGVQLVSGYDMGTIEDELIWSAHTGDSGAPLISKQGSLVLWAEFGSPLQSYDSLAQGTHWNANTEPDKTGNDVSDNITLVQTQYGQSVKLKFSNAGNQSAYLVVPDTPPLGAPTGRTALVYGVLYSVEVMAIAEEDTDSQDDYGKRGLNLDVPFKSNPNDIQAQAQFLLAKYDDAVPRAISVRHTARTAWPDTTIRVQCLSRDISDRITLKSTKLGVDTDYYINKIIQEYLLNEGGFVHETTWIIERALGDAEGVFWLLGLAGFGELSETTRLGI